MIAVKWNRSNEGICHSKCGRFEIEPIFMGCCTPQAYNILKDGNALAKYVSTQKECKAIANKNVDVTVKSPLWMGDRK